MAQVSVEQLNQLIKDSPVLSAAEQQEWLKLVEFMNDKQLQDLHNILSPEATPTAEVEVTSPVPKPIPFTTPPRAVRPSLAQGQGKQALPPRAGVPPASGEGKSPTVASIGAGAPLQAFLKRTMPKAGPVPAETVLTSEKNTDQSKFQAWKKQVAETVAEKELTSPVSLPREKVEVATPPPLAPVAVAVPAPKVPEVIIEETVEQPLEVVEEKHGEFKFVSQAESSQATDVKTLADVEHIGTQTLRHLGAKNLLEKLFKLVKRHGYFEVLFTLEQSPLYSAYLTTGKKLIDQQVSFDEIGESETEEAYLNKEEFESSADLLRNLASL